MSAFPQHVDNLGQPNESSSSAADSNNSNSYEMQQQRERLRELEAMRSKAYNDRQTMMADALSQKLQEEAQEAEEADADLFRRTMEELAG